MQCVSQYYQYNIDMPWMMPPYLHYENLFHFILFFSITFFILVFYVDCIEYQSKEINGEKQYKMK